MEDSFEKRLYSLVRDYDRGRILTWDFAIQLVSCAAYAQFFQNLPKISDVVMAELYELAKEAPAHPEDVAFATTAIFHSPDDFKAWDRRVRLEHYWGSRRIREHFFPDLPIPKFKPHILIGTVEDTCMSDDMFVIRGQFDVSLIRDNSTTLRQDGTHTSICILGNTYGPPGLIVDPESIIPSVIRPGAEVWVDRTAIQEIPPPPESI